MILISIYASEAYCTILSNYSFRKYYIRISFLLGKEHLSRDIMPIVQIKCYTVKKKKKQRYLDTRKYDNLKIIFAKSQISAVSSLRN